MKIAIGSDHGGYGLKSQLANHLRANGYDVIDVGTSSNEAVDYPVFAEAVARQVAVGTCERGIVVDGAGIGSAMAANKVPGIRAALAYDLSSALNSREHNNANVLTLGAGLIGPALARQIVDAWLGAECSEERHLRRSDLILAIEGAGSAPLGRPAGEPQITDRDLARIAERLEVLLGKDSCRGSSALTAGGTAAPTVAASPPTARRFLGLGVARLSSEPGLSPAGSSIPTDLAGYIDHTLLRPDARAEHVRSLCAEAREHRFAAVCVNPIWIRLVARELRGTPVLPCAVVGFPLGATHPETKALEARRAIREGAREIDMVINIGALKDGEDQVVLRDIRAVVEACRDGSACCKVIIETALLDDEEKRLACRLARKARAQFVKTSTGFASGGATAADVALMASEVSTAGMGVKASGGIRTLADATEMIAAGATRIGASAGVAILEGARDLAATMSA